MPDRTPHRGVIVGTDGSSSSQAALDWAAREAAMRHLPLTVVHAAAVPVAGYAPMWPTGRVPTEVIEDEQDQARRIVADAVKFVEDSAAGSGRPEINSELLAGAAVPTLVGLSKAAKLMVVGCRPKHGRLLGSVGAGLIHHAHCPVAVIPEATESTAHRLLPVLVGIDGSHASELATELAFDEASWRGVDLVALHVWSDTDMSTSFGVDSAALYSAAEKTLAERLAGWEERYPEVTVHRLIEFEYPARKLLDHAEKAQLVVVGSHGRGAIVGVLLGSVGRAVAQAARAPVIVARRS